MRAEMADRKVRVEVLDGHVVVTADKPLNEAEARWLQAVALPMALDSLVRLAPAPTTDEDEVPIPGQTSIDEVLET